MIDAPLAVAFTAGLVATLNPCGFAMLPAYLSWHLGDDPPDNSQGGAGLAESRLADRIARSLTVGGTVSAGFLLVFGATGAIVTAGARRLLVDHIGWAALVVGVLVAGLGVALLAGREISLRLPRTQAGTKLRGPGAMLAFGASYAVASLSCTLPVFLAVVTSTFTRTGIATGTLTFLAYGTGMSLVLMTLTVALAFAKHGLVARLRAAARHINLASGALLVLAGIYLVAYGAWNLGAEPGDTTGPVSVLDNISTRANQAVQDLGWAPTALTLGGILTAAALAVYTSRHTGSDDDCCPPDTNAHDGIAISTATICDPGCDVPVDPPGRSNPYRPAMTAPPA